MSLFGSLVTGATALNAQAKSTAIIANNIANATSTGFKRSEASFYEIVADESSKGTLSNGVYVNRVQRVDQAGAIRQTVSTTESAILGNGMYAVKGTPNSEDEFLYTRNGTFDEYTISTGEDLLRNAAGYYLYGWQLDSSGNISGGNDLNSLVPIDVSVIDQLGLPTTDIRIDINLDASLDDYDPHLVDADQQLPLASQQAQYVRNIEVYDSNGDAQQLTLEFRKITGPMAHFTTDTFKPLQTNDVIADNLNGPTPTISNGDIFSVSDGTNTLNITFTSGTPAAPNEAQTISDMLVIINNSSFVDAEITSEGRFLIRALDPNASLDISGSSASTITGFNIVQDANTPANIFNAQNIGTTYPGQGNFPPIADLATPNTGGWWEVTISTPAQTVSQGLLNFDGNGLLNAPSIINPANGFTEITDGEISLSNIDFGASTISSLNIDMARISQYVGPSTTIFSEQNGAPRSGRTGVEITRDGTIRALFSNGAAADIYKVPLVNFISPNHLMEVNGTAYAQTEEAGEARVLEAGIDGAGFFSPATIEASNVDFADEFANLIVSQRSYTAGSQLMRTVDEMVERLGQLNR
jgi:flagellar hook protein FlgE